MKVQVFINQIRLKIELLSLQLSNQKNIFIIFSLHDLRKMFTLKQNKYSSGNTFKKVCIIMHIVVYIPNPNYDFCGMVLLLPAVTR